MSHRRSLQDAIVQLNHSDCWCSYQLKPGSGSSKFIQHYAAFEMPGGPTAEPVVEQEWLRLAFEDRACIVTPGGDGRYLDLRTEAGPTPSWAEQALIEAEQILGTIESEYGPMTLDEWQNANVISRPLM